MKEKLENEMIYLGAYMILKSLLDKGQLSKEVFERINIKNASCQGCKAIVSHS